MGFKDVVREGWKDVNGLSWEGISFMHKMKNLREKNKRLEQR